MDAAVVIKNDYLEARVLFYGATLQRLVYRGINVVVGFDTEKEYRGNSGYIGATVGRYANRISRGTFKIGEKTYDVGCNEAGRGHLHGGVVGMDKRIFTPTRVSSDSVTLSLELLDGEEGYPGNMNVSVTYALKGSSLIITYDADTDADTVFNPTNHSYFNLNGSGNILTHMLTVDADEYIPVDEKLIPLSSTAYVGGTPFDFRMPKAIGRDLKLPDAQLEICGGYDHTYVLNNGKAVLSSPENGMIMVVDTDMPGIQVYSGNFIQETGGDLECHAGVALETQFYPDSPNRPDFPSPILRAGEHFNSSTTYTFDG